MNQLLRLPRFVSIFGLLSLFAAGSSDYDQPHRPQFHFSPRANWTNDPNGLVYFQGEYHLFYQYNPFGDRWGHMSWGHAVSRDLMHWEELPVALPEENGVMIFTGSAVIDENNTTGFCTGGQPCLVAVYTGYTPGSGSRPSLQTQNLAYSNDRGRTWTKYAANPVLDLHMADFRDPKVFWSKQTGRWIMAVSLPNDHKIAIYGSGDMKSWKPLSEFGPAGAIGGQWECPELFEAPLAGHPDEKHWVLKVGLNPGSLQGGSGEQYFIGNFDGTRFTNDNPVSLTLWTDYGKDCYCALTFGGLPPEREPVMLGWMSNWTYAQRLPTSPWRGQMTVPRKVMVRDTGAGLRLVQMPVDELQQLAGGRLFLETKNLSELNAKLAHSTLPGQNTFELRVVIPMGAAKEVGLKVFAADGTFTAVGYDKGRSALYVDRRHSGPMGFSSDFPARVEAPLVPTERLTLDLVVDRSSLEVFANDGEVAMTDLVYPPPGAFGIQFYANGQTGKVSVSRQALKSIYAPEKKMSRSTANFPQRTTR